MKKLIIWDFDGVIADTEKLWVKSRLDLLNNEFNINWDFDTAAKYLGGRSDRDKKTILENLGIIVDDNFWVEAMKLDMEKLEQGVEITPAITDIFELKQFQQCIATGGVRSKTMAKVNKTGVFKYFSENKIFTVDMVEKGKPAPDLFLLAARIMGFESKDCIVIEDSIAGLTAAQNAKMTPIAFVKYNEEPYKNEIYKMNLPYIFDDMGEIKELLLTKFM